MALTMNSTSPLRTASTGGQAAPLPAELIAVNEARRRQANAAYEEAAATGSAQTGRILADKLAASRNLASDFTNERLTGMRQLGSMGMARNPRFADRLRRELVRRQTREQASMERQAAMQLANIEEIVAAARRARDRQLLDVESQEVLARTQLSNVFNAPVYGGV